MIMALIDSGNHSNAQRPDTVPPAAAVSGNAASIPHDYLARLPLLHAEASRNAGLGRFVARSVTMAGLLIVMGGATLLTNGGSLQSDFVWSVLVLAGIAAMAVNFIRGPARSLRRTSLEASAAGDLRAILLYTGFAWGAGAFLALPADPGFALAFAFAMGPALLLAVLLKDEAGIAAFTAPAVGLAAAAALLLHWSGGRIIAPLLLAAGIVLILVSHLQSARSYQDGRRTV